MKIRSLPKCTRTVHLTRNTFDPETWYLCLWWVYITNEPIRTGGERDG